MAPAIASVGPDLRHRSDQGFVDLDDYIGYRCRRGLAVASGPSPTGGHGERPLDLPGAGMEQSAIHGTVVLRTPR
jgi:hypothetical protein